MEVNEWIAPRHIRVCGPRSLIAVGTSEQRVAATRRLARTAVADVLQIGSPRPAVAAQLIAERGCLARGHATPSEGLILGAEGARSDIGVLRAVRRRLRSRSLAAGQRDRVGQLAPAHGVVVLHQLALLAQRLG